MSKITLLNVDCMDYMRSLENKAFDLAIVDPPYGLGDTLVAGGTWSVKYQAKGAAWDVAPGREYFEELRRVSQHQIIWGGNYFTEFIKAARCCISWVKPNMAGMHTMSDFELALTSFDRNAKVINLSSQANEQRIHVTQKPVKLYEWLLTNYAKPGQRILDTHLGSGSSAIAAHNLGFDFVGMELDADYYAAACKRFEQHTAQGSLFVPDTPRDAYEQTDLLYRSEHGA
jgi:site-specific DNA-methyltransferase (adenine-specific)